MKKDNQKLSQSHLEDQNAANNFFESDAGDGTKRQEQYLYGMELYTCLVAILACLFLMGLDQTIVSTILSDVGQKFNSYNEIGWLTSGFMLTVCVFTPVWGKLSIAFGRKVCFLLCVFLFEVGSLITALANGMNMLIGGRVLAGIGGGGIQVVAYIVIAEIVSIDRRPLAMGLVGVIYSFSAILGPIICGLFTTYVTWRWCFYVNLPIGGLAFIFLVFLYNPPKAHGTFKEKIITIDYLGIFLIISGLVIFLLALTLGSENKYSWNSAAIICCFIIGCLLIIAFFVWTFSFSKNPLIPFEIVKVIQISAAAITAFAMLGYFFGTLVYVVFYFQVILGKDSIHSGISLLPIIIAMVISTILCAILIQKTTYVKPFTLGAGVLGPIGMGTICLLDIDSSTSKQIGYLIIFGVAVGFQVQLCLISAQISAPKTPGSTILSTTFINFSRSLGASIITCLSQAVYTSSFSRYYTEGLKRQTNEKIAEELRGLTAKHLNSSTNIIKDLSPVAQNFVKIQIMKAIKNVFYMTTGVACLSFITCLFMTNKKLPKEETSSTIKQEEH